MPKQRYSKYWYNINVNIILSSDIYGPAYNYNYDVACTTNCDICSPPLAIYIHLENR